MIKARCSPKFTFFKVQTKQSKQSVIKDQPKAQTLGAKEINRIPTTTKTYPTISFEQSQLLERMNNH